MGVAAGIVSLLSQSTVEFAVGLATVLALFLRIPAGKVPIITDRPLSALGRWSYSLYLIHVPVGVYGFGTLRGEWVLAHEFTHFAFDLPNLGFCIMLAAVFSRWVEAPSHHLARAISKDGFRALSPRLNPAKV